MISWHQVRAARALLNWSADTLASKAGITRETVNRIERGFRKPHDETLAALACVLESHGIEFGKNDGVARRETNIRRFAGPDTMNGFLDDVYETVKGGGTICISSDDEDLVGQYYEVRGELHSARMARREYPAGLF